MDTDFLAEIGLSCLGHSTLEDVFINFTLYKYIIFTRSSTCFVITWLAISFIQTHDHSSKSRESMRCCCEYKYTTPYKVKVFCKGLTC